MKSNDLSKFTEFTSKNKIQPDEPLFYSDLNIEHKRTKIYEARNFVISQINLNKIVIDKNSRLEISHHYGIDKFDEYGASMITVLNLEYCKKIIFQTKNQKHPTQYHRLKKETFLCISGQIEINLDGNIRILNPGDIITILPNVKHSWIALQDTIIEEISTQHLSEDSFYIDEEIMNNDNRKSYISIFGSIE